jgi:eukaryotic-like serine/threonine-protein kinase
LLVARTRRWALDSGAEAFQNAVSPNVTQAIDTEAAAASLVGTVLAGRYRIERLLGSGGMGSVYRAEHVLMRKACAVKVLHREMMQVQEVVARFEREAVAAGRIEHPNVAAATDFGQLENGAFYLVLEFIEGKSLGQLIGELGALPEERALVISRQIADALAAAHAAGVVHRDLKPDNVMLVARGKEGGADLVKVLDFGIAKVQIEGMTADQPALTRLNTVMGTPEYMAPEQARGEDVDVRADLYTLGVILYEMLAGTSPFRHEEFVVVLTKKLTEDPPPLPAHVSAATRELVLKLLERTPSQRPQSAAEVVSRIDGILGYSPAPSTAFAPVSAPVRKPQPTNPDVAYANTVIGEAPISAPRSSAISRIKLAGASAKTLLAPALDLAKRRVAVGQKQVPLGAIGGALFGLPVVVALGLATASGGASNAAAPASSSIAAPPADDDLSELMKRAEGGDRTALAELSGRAAEVKQAGAYLALGHGYFKIGQLDAGLRAYRSGGKLDPKLGDTPGVVAELRRGLADPKNEQLALDVATALGTTGADFLWDVYDSNRTANPALSKQAKALLDSEAVAAIQSPALKLVLEFPKAKTEGCTALKKLMPRIQESGDARLVPALTRLSDRRGCGFLGLRDCFACLRTEKGKDLAAATKAATERPAPKLGS